MVTRIRVDAEGPSQEECREHINAVFSLLRQNAMSVTMTFGGHGIPTSNPPIVSGETEFVEEVYETQISDHGAIHWKGRRIIRYLDPTVVDSPM